MKICFPLVNALPLAGSSTCPPIDEARLAHPSPGVARANIVGKTADVVYSVLKVTKEHGRRELALVLAQDQLVDPAEHFAVVRLF